MPVIGGVRSFHKKFKFLVRVEDPVAGQRLSAGFQTVSELSAEVAKIEHYEGGNIRPFKEPGRVTYTDLTLERGATSDRLLWDWWEQVVFGAALRGLTGAEYCRDIEILQLDRDDSILRRWLVYGCFPQKFMAGEWDNDADENVIESVVLTYNYFDLIQ